MGEAPPCRLPSFLRPPDTLEERRATPSSCFQCSLDAVPSRVPPSGLESHVPPDEATPRLPVPQLLRPPQAPGVLNGVCACLVGPHGEGVSPWALIALPSPAEAAPPPTPGRKDPERRRSWLAALPPPRSRDDWSMVLREGRGWRPEAAPGTQHPWAGGRGAPAPADRRAHPFHPGPGPVRSHRGGLGAILFLCVCWPQAPGLARWAWSWQDTNGQGGQASQGGCCGWRVVASVTRTPSQRVLSSHLPTTGICCLTLVIRQPAGHRPGQVTGLHPKSRPRCDPPCPCGRSSGAGGRGLAAAGAHSTLHTPLRPGCLRPHLPRPQAPSPSR